MPEENEIPLIVEGRDSSPTEIRFLMEKTAQHPSDTMTESSIEIIHNHFGFVIRGQSTALHSGRKEGRKVKKEEEMNEWMDGPMDS